jgi:signal transduction histidine kinase
MPSLPVLVNLLVTILPNNLKISSLKRKMNRNRKIFIIATLVFVSIVALIAIDMARRTTAPWNKKKQIVRAFDVTTESDSIAVDTTK